MKLVSQNCGGLVGFLAYAKEEFKTHFEKYKDCDLILIQELRVDKKNCDRLREVLNIFESLGYPNHSILWSEKGNGGCITFSKTRLTTLNTQRSVLTTHTSINGNDFVIANCYIPNFGYSDGKEKVEFMKNSFDLFGDITNFGDVTTIIAGDFNAALSKEHCKYKNKPGCFPSEVKWINDLSNQLSLSCGNVTAEVTDENGLFYTYYSFRGRGKGKEPFGSMRIDHVFVTNHSEIDTVVDNTTFLRDHFPLVSTVKVKDEKK